MLRNNLLGNIDITEYADFKNRNPLNSGKLDLIAFKDITPNISFKYISLNKSLNNFSFDYTSPFINSEDYFELLKKLQQISSTSLVELISKEDNRKVKYSDKLNYHTKVYFQEVYKIQINTEQFPSLIHFHLEHTNKNTSNREKNIKRIVVHGFISHDCIYILFYDPFHEVYQTQNI